MTDHRWRSVRSDPPSGDRPTDERPGVWSIVVAAGTGARFGGDIPKQYVSLGDRRVLDHSLALLRRVCGDRLVLVVSAERCSDPEPLAGVVACGGATRTDSVRAGLACVPLDAQIVLVHDAARPLVPFAVVERVLAALSDGTDGADGVVPGLALTDTVKVVDASGTVVATPDRATLRAVQTPQAFSAAVLRRVLVDGADATDDAALVEAAGGRVVVVAGDPLARKVTTDEDLTWLAQRLPSLAATVGGALP